ncbi:MAG TPA: cytochrome P450 [Polyangia bacterium]
MTTSETTDANSRPPSNHQASAELAPQTSRGRPRPIRPPWRDLMPLMRAFSTDILGALTLVRDKYGDFVRTRLPLHIYFVYDPRAIEEILLKKADAFRKDYTSRLLSRVVGKGLLLSEGESWRRQRRLVQPAFHHQQLQSYAALMVGAIERAMPGWRNGEVRDVHADMMGVTLDIVAESLFGADVSAVAGDIGLIIGELMEEFGKVLGLAARFQPPAWVPTPTSRRLRRTRRRMDALLLGIIETRKHSQETRDDLLSLLIRARDEGGGQMTDEQVRDEAIILFLAGHETTALALTYALYLLATHPDSQARLADEVRRVLGGRSPGLGDLDKLAFTEAVVLESMRLYPPAWGIARESLTPVEIAGYAFPRGATFVMSTWAVHRDPRIFEDPATFKPERWQDDLQKRLPRFAYFPFGGGPRVCIGNRFAMMEAKLVLARTLQRFRFDPTPETEMRLFPSVTLRPRGGVRLRISER